MHKNPNQHQNPTVHLHSNDQASRHCAQRTPSSCNIYHKFLPCAPLVKEHHICYMFSYQALRYVRAKYTIVYATARNTNVPPLALIAAGAVLLISKPDAAVSI